MMENIDAAWAEWKKGKPTEPGWYEARWKHNMFGRELYYKARIHFDGKKWEKRGVYEWRHLRENSNQQEPGG